MATNRWKDALSACASRAISNSLTFAAILGESDSLYR
jgi:hypothetical protein